MTKDQELRLIIRIQCPDEKGLVYRASRVLYEHGLNLLVNDEFVDAETGRFFFRTEAEGPADLKSLSDALVQALPHQALIDVHEKAKKEIVVLVTKEPYCLADILTRHQYGDLNAHVKAVIGNHASLQGLAEQFAIPFYHVPAEGVDRQAHEQALMKTIRPLQPDYVVLAKYMRVLSSDFTEEFPNRIINIHHSFLPAFVGPKPYRQAFQRGVKVIGATAHFVNEDLDEGPIIAQDVIHVTHRLSPNDMARRGKAIERTVLGRAMDLVFEDRVFVNGRRTIVME